MVELAIAVPILALLLCAAIDLGRLAYMAITLNDAARAGAEYGAQSVVTASDNAGMQCAVYQDGKDVASMTGNAGSSCSCPASYSTTPVCGITASPSHACYCPDGSQAQCGDAFCANGSQSVYVTVTASATFTPITRILPMPSSFSVSSTATRRVSTP